MKPGRFYTSLAIACIITVLLLTLLTSLPDYNKLLDFGLITTAVFAFTCIPIYYLFSKLAVVPRKTIFVSATIGNMFFRILLSSIILILYYISFDPPEGHFVVPFLLVYVIFTIFETYILIKIADQKPK